ncbi:MAG: hypothetical protein KKE62_03290 [Proteobacteria bacterium]|nr:hypothetical protein [Pseudomonadota bacterium]MBU1388264.1 hypothetical protein [Pseudomonadota bacterium]MBU1541847.1 hypothetical protein [Pseudomonadota bacterium]MBU2481518.1 hypothetical protein [Pseudomonadota bacterium]
MKILLYANNRENTGKQIEKHIKEEPRIEIETLDSVTSLSQKLCQPLHRIMVIILVIQTKEEITQFLDLIPLLENIRIILVLPDRDKHTLAVGIKLNPSFISYTDDDLDDITQVLKKIQKITLH